ncbi:MAG: hypothetical protein PHR44_02960 [Candidatus Omnitrophica bacterium]|nr:hypothetical protein [Candidatus Omnitrophota bacterium]
MNIKGVKIVRNNKSWVCHVDDFSDDLKEIIRKNLQEICYGAKQVSDFKKTYTYKNTLNNFLDRYSRKTDEQKKGMLGELLAHVLLVKSMPNLTRTSIFFNPGERNIKKGFDIIFLDTSGRILWYSEVKSGEKHKKSVNDSNSELLKSARKDVKTKIGSKLAYLWDNAMVDAQLTTEKQVFETLKSLLEQDCFFVNKTAELKGHAIIVSVLYASMSEKIDVANLNNLYEEIEKNGDFKDLIIYSIQKETFKKIEDFLTQEKDK